MIDSVIKAELPTIEENPSLRDKVLKYNMHRNDHLSSPSNRCYKNGKCVYNCPKQLQETTVVDDSGRVVFRRRKEEDKMVVSYMPFLTELMDCHVNVDVTFTVNIIMYLYKYLFKGPDNARYTITDPNQPHSATDEIKDFVNARYVSASEGTWSIFGNETTRKFPVVTCLPVHLPGENFHQMHRKDGNASTASKLLRYFARPTAQNFQLLKYTEFYNRYLHKPLARNCTVALGSDQWLEQPSPDINIPQMVSARAAEDIVSRLTFISPRQGEVFYLRALLLHKPAYSYEELRSVNGIIYPTFQEAAIQLGLFANINEAENCLQEAVAFHYAPYHLRFLYAQLIIDIPAPALELWEKYKDELSADHSERFGRTDRAYLEALRDIERVLTLRGSNLSDFGLPDPGNGINELEIEYQSFGLRIEELSRTADDMIARMNPQQLEAFNVLYTMVTSTCPTHTVFYLDGKAGRGKSFVASALCTKLRSENRVPVITGTTALSVTMYERGRTAHSAFGIPVSQVSSYLQS